MLVIQSKKIVFLFFLFITVAGFSQAQKFPATIKVDGGLISGTNNSSNDIHIYKGIPFAAPPINDLRWKEPQPVIAWSGIKKCDAFSASPMQGKPVPFGVYTKEFLIPDSPISEDCLYLNVWTGAKSSSEKRPVIVWIYGGGFVSGGSGCPIYDGEAMAKKGIVFVSINYRVGVFGFFAYPELTKESGHNASGNYGLMDQIAALKWVKKNIAAFGGNPGNVTIAGQSAGSISVNDLVVSPLSKGLFKHAIAESAAAFINGMIHTGTLKQAEEDGIKTARSFQVSSISDLRKISAEELLKKAQGTGPIVDGYVLPDAIANIFAAGKQNDVEVITGWNDDDAFVGSLKNAEDYKKEVKEKYGNDAETFLKYYPATTDSEAAASQVKINRDLLVGIQNYAWANTQSEKGKAKIYVYNFNRKVPATADFVKYGAFHTGEVVYAYDNLKFEDRPWQQTDKDLAELMSSYWVNFATTGNPNGKGLPEWPAYNTKQNKLMQFDEKSKVKSLPTKDELDFLIGRMK
jgi:para-nitrobenzyl esterase